MAGEVGAVRGVDKSNNFLHSFSSCCVWQAGEAIGGQGVDRGTSEDLGEGGGVGGDRSMLARSNL